MFTGLDNDLDDCNVYGYTDQYNDVNNFNHKFQSFHCLETESP